jgi:hypothetical protein
MTTATARWGVPTKRQSGLPVDPDDYKGCEIAIAVAGGPFTVLTDLVPTGTFEREMPPDLTPGDYECRYVPIDVDDVRGKQSIVPFKIRDETALDEVDNPTVDVV